MVLKVLSLFWSPINYTSRVLLLIPALTVTYGGSLRMEDKVFTTDLYNPNSVQFKEMEKYVCDMVSTQLSRVQKHGETCVINRVPLDSGHMD